MKRFTLSKLILSLMMVSLTLFMVSACGGDSSEKADTDNAQEHMDDADHDHEDGDMDEDANHEENGDMDENESNEFPKGVGPVTDIDLGELDQVLADKGKELYGTKCVACHQIDTKLIGPPQAGVLDRRSPEWVMNMMLNPTEMVEKDETAKALFEEYNKIPMAIPGGLTEEEARAILEYFRTI
jgi:mono/diheme cytochrome c family protein